MENKKSEILNRIIRRINARKLDLQVKTLACIDQIEGTPFMEVVATLSTVYEPYAFNLESIRNTVIRTISQENPFSFVGRYWSRDTELNCINVYVVRDEIPLASYNYRFNRYQLFNECKSQFWRVGTNEIQYNHLASFCGFQDHVVINPKSLQKYSCSGYKWNQKEWVSYINELLKYIFSDYFITCKHNRDLTMTKSINDNIKLLIDYDIKRASQMFNSEELHLGDLNIYMLFKLPNNDGWEQVNIGQFRHPIIQEPTAVMRAFIYWVKMKDPADVRNSNGIRFENEVINQGNGNYMIKYSKELDDELKRHAFFYYACLKYSTDVFVDFLIDSFSDFNVDDLL